MRDPPLPRSGKDFSRDKKRYGWCRLYNDFTGHPKWRRVSRLADVHLGFVHTIVVALFNAASKARRRGWIGDFDFDTVEAATDVPSEQVAAVVRVLIDIGWISAEHITDWLDRQPEAEDPTATERQRNKRAKDAAKRAVAMGVATADQVEMLNVAEREALHRLAQTSRVTAVPPPPPAPVVIVPFALVEPAEDTHQARERARIETEAAAREWLFGRNKAAGVSYGAGVKVIAEHTGCTLLSADATLRRTLKENLFGDVVALATIVSAAFEQAIDGEHFQNVVRQRISEYERERNAGPPLPLGMITVRGGRS